MRLKPRGSNSVFESLLAGLLHERGSKERSEDERSSMNIILVGFMGCGKSAVGGVLARRLGYHLLDTDAWIEKQLQCSLAALFQEGGEAKFRALEAALARRMPQLENHVIATGGGMGANAENLKHLLCAGRVIFLDLPEAELFARIRNSRKRPLVNPADPELEQKLCALYSARRPLYEQAHITLHTEQMKLHEVCREALLKLVDSLGE